MKEVSVVITIYNNSQKELAKLLQFVEEFNSKYEIIIIDDSSNINLKYIDELSSYCLTKKVIFIKTKINMGPSGARNVGILKSKCKYIAFLDGDDEWSHYKIDTQIKFLECGYDVIGSAHKAIINNTKENKSQYEKNNSMDVKNSADFVKKVSFYDLLFKNQFCTPSVVARSFVFKENLFDENMRYAEDYDLWLRISKKYKISKISLPLVFTFKHDFISSSNSLSSKIVKMEIGELKALFKQFQYTSNFLDSCLISIALLFSITKFFRRLLIRLIFNFGLYKI